MKIGILSFVKNKSSAEEVSLRKAALALGHSAKIFKLNHFKMVYDRKSPWLLYEGKPLPKYDIFIVRPSTLGAIDLSITLVEQMELMGIKLFNDAGSILKSKNKVRTMQILDHFGIPIPRTVVVRRPNDLVAATEALGGFPMILKEPFGSYGNGVVIVESMRALNSAINWAKPLYLLQEFVKFSRGRDIRIFVVNGRVVASMMRAARKGEFRSNIELGGKGMPVEITDEEAGIAIRAVQVLGLSYGGVDLMRSKSGPVVLEVNSNPGFKALEVASKVNVAEKIVEYAIEVVNRSS